MGDDGKSRSYRSEIIIIRDILSSLNKPTLRGLRKTRLLYAANLNTTMGNLYVRRLQASRLISLDDDSTFKITSKGVRVLRLLNTIISELEREDDGWGSRIMDSLREAADSLGIGLHTHATRRGVLGSHRIDMLLNPDGDPTPVMLAEDVSSVENVLPWLLLAMLDLGYHKGVIFVRGHGRVRSISINSIKLRLVEMAEPSIEAMIELLTDLDTPDPSAS